MKFFVTCGSGLNPFFKKEINNKFDIIINESEQIIGDGKIIFDINIKKQIEEKHDDDNNDIDNDDLNESIKIVSNLITNLKTVERLFGFILYDTIDTKLNLKTRRGLLSYYYQIASKIELKNILQYWASVKLTNLKQETQKDEYELGTPHKHSKLENDSNSNGMNVGFRISSKLQQEPSYLTHSQEVSKTIGTAIVKTMSIKGWNIKLKNPDLEIMVNINNTYILIGIPLTNKPLSERNYLQHIPLRSTISYSMGSLLFNNNEKSSTKNNLNPIIILDPMCGTCTILIEIAINFSSLSEIILLYGIDRDINQIYKANENIKKANVKNIVCLIQGDCRQIFKFKFDCIICDLPFGKKHGTIHEIKINLHEYIINFDRYLIKNGKIVLLISEELSSLLETIVIDNNKDLNWTMINKFPIKQGVLPSIIFLFMKDVAN